MIDKIRDYIMSVRYKHYSDMAEYYFDKAVALGVNGHYEESEDCFDRAYDYLKKQYRITMKLMRMA